MKDSNNNMDTCTGHGGRETIDTWKCFLVCLDGVALSL